MADFLDQAKAIWKALDEMSAKDPEEYKRFISEQLQDGKNSNMFQRSGQQPSQPPTGKKSSSGPGKKQDQEQPLMEALGKLSLNRSPNPIPPNAAKKSESGKKKAGVGNGSKAEKSGKSNPKEDEKEKYVNLLDDEILDKSMISNIVKKANPSKSKLGDDDQEDDEPEVTIGELRIPSAESFPAPRAGSKNKPLIEEL